ncbi:hypothetical protein HAZT_HAZT002309 [Hyalella azteca]|uniref:Uncharacterized protein n=1 Tax=Hyalella azteca TaxID=294128 RepID=A0A6A0H6C2_HYAAZ|nr:hypothetical protein HAZT_HAZT002309 [Hyalella azteca]
MKRRKFTAYKLYRNFSVSLAHKRLSGRGFLDFEAPEADQDPGQRADERVDERRDVCHAGVCICQSITSPSSHPETPVQSITSPSSHPETPVQSITSPSSHPETPVQSITSPSSHPETPVQSITSPSSHPETPVQSITSPSSGEGKRKAASHERRQLIYPGAFFQRKVAACAPTFVLHANINE